MDNFSQPPSTPFGEPSPWRGCTSVCNDSMDPSLPTSSWLARQQFPLCYNGKVSSDYLVEVMKQRQAFDNIYSIRHGCESPTVHPTRCFPPSRMKKLLQKLCRNTNQPSADMAYFEIHLLLVISQSGAF